MVYASLSRPYSYTDKTDENARPQIQVWSDVSSGETGGAETGSFKEFGSDNTANIEGLNAVSYTHLIDAVANVLYLESL